MTKNKGKLLEKLKEKKIMKTSEITKILGNRAGIGRMVEAGELILLGAGFYAHPSMDPFDAAILVAGIYYPYGVLSNVTVLSLHSLTDERIDIIDVDIPRNKSIRNRLIKAHRVPDAHLIGIEKIAFQGYEISAYSKERSLSEAFKIDPNGPLFFKALKRYVAGAEIDTQEIKRFDDILKTDVLTSLSQELADA